MQLLLAAHKMKGNNKIKIRRKNETETKPADTYKRKARWRRQVYGHGIHKTLIIVWLGAIGITRDMCSMHIICCKFVRYRCRLYWIRCWLYFFFSFFLFFLLAYIFACCFFHRFSCCLRFLLSCHTNCFTHCTYLITKKKTRRKTKCTRTLWSQYL